MDIPNSDMLSDLFFIFLIFKNCLVFHFWDQFFVPASIIIYTALSAYWAVLQRQMQMLSKPLEMTVMLG